MRFGLMVAAVAAMVSAAPVGAATIVQGQSEAGSFAGVTRFNVAMGTLTKVTLDITVNKYRDWAVTVPSGSGSSVDVTWATDGMWNLYTFPNVPSLVGLTVPLRGSGVQTVPLTYDDGSSANGFFTLNVKGAASFELDPADFLGTAATDAPNRIVFDGNDPGRYRDVFDTTFSTDGTSRFTKVNSCQGYSFGDDSCGETLYRLTYEYARVGEPVPEPATWAMMVLGFVGVGHAMRRRVRKQGAAIA